MTTYAWPSTLDVANFAMWPEANVRGFASPFGGSEQVVDLLNERWRVSLELGPEYSSIAAALEAFFNKLRGGVHTVSLWHMARPAPQGTMRGSPTLAAAAAQGAASISVQSTAAWTLKAGDMLGVGGLLLQVADDMTFPGGGIGTVNLVGRLRKALSSGAAVTWDKPTIPFRLASPAVFTHARAIVAGQALELVEAI